MVTATRPTLAAIETLLRNGYWDRTEVIRMADASLRVRKQSKGQESNGPWGQDNLRAEANYIEELEPHLLDLFPRLIASWENPAPGYDMAYMAGFVDVAQLARSSSLNQHQADAFQNQLGKRVFGQLHTPCDPTAALANNVLTTLQQAAQLIETSDALRLLAQDQLLINGQPCSSLSKNITALKTQTHIFKDLEKAPQVRLHGDLFLENILLPQAPDTADVESNPHWPTQLMLIDPVSVAGMSMGHPLFDLAKYESYACGELPAMRRGHMVVTGFDQPSEETNNFSFAINWQAKEMEVFNKVNWHQSLRQSYVSHYGAIDRTINDTNDEALYALLEAYFAAAMVLCTNGVEHQARALKAILSLQNAVDLSL